MSKIFFTLLVLCVLKNSSGDPSSTPSASSTGGTGSTGTGSTGTGLTIAGSSGNLSNLSCLTDSQKDTLCNSATVGTTLCPTVGPADSSCTQISALIQGSSSPSCVAPGVCAFVIPPTTGTTGLAGTGSTSTGGSDSTGSTGTGTTGTGTPAGAGGYGPTGAPGSSGSTGTTGSVATGGDPAYGSTGAPGSSGSTGTTGSGAPGGLGGYGQTGSSTGTPAGGDSSGTGTTGTGTTAGYTPITPQPNTAYISCKSTPPGFINVRSCPTNGINVIYPAGAGTGVTGTGSTGTSGTGSTGTAGTGSTGTSGTGTTSGLKY